MCLQNYLVEANIRLVRLEYLFKLAEAGRVWPRRQEAEAEEFEDSHGKIRTALVTMEEIRNPMLQLGDETMEGNRVILSVSHTWESQQHPDPWGAELQSLLQYLQSGSIDHPLRFSRATLQFWRHTYDIQFWVFFDFMCSMRLLYGYRHIARVIRLEELTPEHQKLKSGFISIFVKTLTGLSHGPLVSSS